MSRFKNVQYGLYQHSTEFCPANLIIPDLLSCLSSICQFNSHFVCTTVNTKYYYTAENWFSGKKAIFTIAEALEKWENSLKKPKKYHSDKLNSMLSVDGFLKIFQ